MRARASVPKGLPLWRWLDNAPPAKFTFDQPTVAAILISREQVVERALKRMKQELRKGKDRPSDRRRRLRLFESELNGGLM